MVVSVFPRNPRQQFEDTMTISFHTLPSPGIILPFDITGMDSVEKQTTESVDLLIKTMRKILPLGSWLLGQTLLQSSKTKFLCVQLLKVYREKNVECENAQNKRTLAVNTTKYSPGRTGSASGLGIRTCNKDTTEYPGT